MRPISLVVCVVLAVGALVDLYYGEMVWFAIDCSLLSLNAYFGQDRFK